MNCACKQSVIPRLGVKRRGALPFFSPSVVGRHAARELTHLAGGLPRSVFARSAVSVRGAFRRRAKCSVHSAPLVVPAICREEPASRSRSSIRHRSSVDAAGPSSRVDHHPAPCGVGAPRGTQSPYSSRMRSLGFRHPSFGSVRARHGARADARNSVSSTGGVPSRAAHLRRQALWC